MRKRVLAIVFGAALALATAGIAFAHGGSSQGVTASTTKTHGKHLGFTATHGKHLGFTATHGKHLGQLTTHTQSTTGTNEGDQGDNESPEPQDTETPDAAQTTA